MKGWTVRRKGLSVIRTGLTVGMKGWTFRRTGLSVIRTGWQWGWKAGQWGEQACQWAGQACQWAGQAWQWEGKAGLGGAKGNINGCPYFYGPYPFWILQKIWCGIIPHSMAFATLIPPPVKTNRLSRKILEYVAQWLQIYFRPRRTVLPGGRNFGQISQKWPEKKCSRPSKMVAEF